MSSLNKKLIHDIAVAMAKSEGWMLSAIDMSNKHCIRYIQLATVAVETMQNVEEREWQGRDWELDVASLQAQHELWSDPPFTPDGKCLLPHQY